MAAHAGVLVLTGADLSVEDVVLAARDPRVTVQCSPAARERVLAAYRLVTTVASDYEARLNGGGPGLPAQDYGITTGFGEFKDVPVAPPDLTRLQVNLLLSHSVGVSGPGPRPVACEHYGADVVRATMLLRLNTFLRGNSGVSPQLVDVLELMLNRGVVPLVPLRGSVGSSGDLAPLAHLFAVLLGHGHFSTVAEPEDVAEQPVRLRPAAQLAEALGLERLPDGLIGPKAGLALINGAAVCAAMLALAVHDAERLADAADAALALTLEAVCGCARAFDPRIHEARPFAGQRTSAANVRALITGSTLVDSADAVQDAYSIRCAPQIHGASRQALRHVREVAQTELNASTDNPLLFPDEAQPWDLAFLENRPDGYRGARAAYSAGNFHGQPVALAADYLAIAAAELADVSERRTQLLLDAHHNRNLPANLVAVPGLNSGLMIAQYAAASLVSENKVLAHPASVDSIPTSANSEDHVSMANHAARKALQVLANAEAVIAVELMTAAQATDWRVAMDRAPSGPRTGTAAQATQSDWQELWRVHRAERDAFAERTAGAGPSVAERLGKGTRQVYRMVREEVLPLVEDRTLDADLRAAWRLIRSGRLSTVVREPS